MAVDDNAAARLDLRSVAEAALLTLAVVVPPVAVVLILESDDVNAESSLWMATPFILLAGFGFGGWTAGRRHRDLPMYHAAAAGAAAFLAVATISVVRRLVGDGISLVYLTRLVLLGIICVSAALLGGYVAARRAR